MRDVTDLFSNYRNCVVQIWNGFFADRVDWDERDLWADACVSLFRAIVLYPLELEATPFLPEYRGGQHAPMRFFHVEPKNEECEVFINREVGRDSGQWDWSRLNRDLKASDLDLRFVHFFDFGCLGTRTLEYLLVMVTASLKYPDAQARYALIRTDHARILLDVEAG